MTEHLRTPKDVKRIREIMATQQNNIDPITKQEVVSGCADHCHSSNLIRGLLSRNVNSWLGRIENSHRREIKWWCSLPLPELLRNIADYLEQEPLDVYHPSWIKRSCIEFGKLTRAQKKSVLNSLGLPLGNNDIVRKAAFKKYISKGSMDFKEIMEMIESVKNDSKEVHP